MLVIPACPLVCPPARPHAQPPTHMPARAIGVLGSVESETSLSSVVPSYRGMRKREVVVMGLPQYYSRACGAGGEVREEVVPQEGYVSRGAQPHDNWW